MPRYRGSGPQRVNWFCCVISVHMARISFKLSIVKQIYSVNNI